MQLELELCRSNNCDVVREIEEGYQIANKFWVHVKTCMRDYQFKDKGEEILFFKAIKPKFLAEKEYYGLLYHASLFDPPCGTWEQKEFWIRESKRLEKFIKENEDFYLYYKSGKTDMDEELFLSDILEAEGTLTVSFSQMIATIMALEKYNTHVLSKLEKKN